MRPKRRNSGNLQETAEIGSVSSLLGPSNGLGLEHSVFRAKYPELYKRLENAALVTKNANACVEILQKDSLSEDEERVKSAYQSLVEIYLQSTIDRRWFELFEKAFADVLTDQSVRSHCKKFNKYLRILAQLQKSDLLLVKCVEMLQLYPSETIPLESICRIYSEKCDDPDFDYEVCPNSRLIRGRVFQMETFIFSPNFPKGLRATRIAC